MVFFEAPHRLAAFLTDASDVFGAERAAVVCRELTKTYEEIVRLPLGDLAAWAQGEVRGEVTVVVAGAVPSVLDAADAVREVLRRVDAGERLKEATAAVAPTSALSRSELYDRTIAARQERATHD